MKYGHFELNRSLGYRNPRHLPFKPFEYAEILSIPDEFAVLIFTEQTPTIARFNFVLGFQ